jgi:hypothetical protein
MTIAHPERDDGQETQRDMPQKQVPSIVAD